MLPDNVDNLNAIMAIAWSKVVQLVEVRDPHRGIDGYIFNGYYESDYEIQTLKWIAEDVLLILTVTKEFKLLYSGNFSPGKYTEKLKEEALNALLLKKRLKKSYSPEIESPFKLTDEFVMQVYTFENKFESDCQTKNSYHQTFVVQNNDIIGLTRTGIDRKSVV